ncbi:hypothetical protein FQN49_001098 [Arthroderma sp. PD_2]|nr:hypothetical protein FQN49_001098 [Arthroderma sp. PD_2]
MAFPEDVSWSLDLTIKPTWLCSAALLVVCMMTKLLFNIGTSFEEIFDYIRIYWVSNKIRNLKELFQSKQELKRQLDWIDMRADLQSEWEVLKQRDIFLREMFIEYATKDKLKELDGLDDLGPRSWEDKLADSRTRLWLNKRAHLETLQNIPKGPRTRGWMVKYTRVERKFSKMGYARCLAQKEYTEPCRENGGCCARDCGCCTKPRDVSPTGEVHYSHCTSLCLCCIRRRGFVRLDQTLGANIPGFVKITDEDVFPQEERQYLPGSLTTQEESNHPKNPTAEKEM